MEPDDFPDQGRNDPLAMLVRQDLDPLSIDELAARVVVLQREIERCRARMDRARDHRSSADALFRS